MAGTFGLELDLAALSEAEKCALRAQIGRFKRFYDLIQHGRYYRLQSPAAGCAVWEWVDDAGTEALVSAVYTGVQANPPLVCVRVRGLQPETLYRVELLDDEEVCTRNEEQKSDCPSTLSSCRHSFSPARRWKPPAWSFPARRKNIRLGSCTLRLAHKEA